MCPVGGPGATDPSPRLDCCIVNFATFQLPDVPLGDKDEVTLVDVEPYAVIGCIKVLRLVCTQISKHEIDLGEGSWTSVLQWSSGVVLSSPPRLYLAQMLCSRS